MEIEQEEMQFLGPFEIFKEAYNIIISWRIIFSQITTAFIFPLSFICLAQTELSSIIARHIARDQIDLAFTQNDSPSNRKFSNLLSSDINTLFIVKIVYTVFLILFSLLSTTAVSYAVACIYTSRNLTFRIILRMVPKVWGRFMATFYCMFVANIIYISFLAAIIIGWTLLLGPTKLGIATLIIFLLLYFAGLCHLVLIGQLAGIVSVLEDTKGLNAISKSYALLRGKIFVAIVVLLAFNICLGAVQFGFQKLVIYGGDIGVSVIMRVGLASAWLSMLSLMFLFGFVIQTVIYLACKSYHHESIDKSALSDQLGLYGGEYAPLIGKDVQLEAFQV